MHQESTSSIDVLKNTALVAIHCKCVCC